jgi:hypothetical protein
VTVITVAFCCCLRQQSGRQLKRCGQVGGDRFVDGRCVRGGNEIFGLHDAGHIDQNIHRGILPGDLCRKALQLG